MRSWACETHSALSCGRCFLISSEIVRVEKQQKRNWNHSTSLLPITWTFFAKFDVRSLSRRSTNFPIPSNRFRSSSLPSRNELSTFSEPEISFLKLSMPLITSSRVRRIRPSLLQWFSSSCGYVDCSDELLALSFRPWTMLRMWEPFVSAVFHRS